MNYLVYDIGGSYIKYCLMTGDREIFFKGKVKTPLEEKACFLVAVEEIFRQFEGQVDGIAISMPGKIDVFNGYAHTAGVLTFLEQTNIVDLFHTFTDLPISVENDGKCAALAESWVGALAHTDHGIVLVFGTGVGGGLIINNRLHRGSSGIAGEFSFVQQTDACHQPAAYFGASGSVLSLVSEGERVKGMEKDTLSGELLFQLIEEGDKELQGVLEKYCDTIALHLFNLQYIFDPETFAIGGGISEQKRFIQEIEKSIDRLKEKHTYHLAVPKIVPCKFRNDANLIGALMNHHLNKVKKVKHNLI